MLYIFGGQSLHRLGARNGFPSPATISRTVSGARFLILPVIVFCVINLGDETRIYRAVFLEEIAQDYVRTARAKGVDNTAAAFHPCAQERAHLRSSRSSSRICRCSCSARC